MRKRMNDLIGIERNICILLLLFVGASERAQGEVKIRRSHHSTYPENTKIWTSTQGKQYQEFQGKTWFTSSGLHSGGTLFCEKKRQYCENKMISEII